jgi:putative DNA primase/helicase
MIDFPNKFEGIQADKQILQKLATESELSGLFNVALQGLKRLLKVKSNN